MAIVAQPGVCEPCGGKLVDAIGHVLAPENTQPQHLLRCEVGGEAGVEIPPRRLRTKIDIVALHQIIDDHLLVPATASGAHASILCIVAALRQSLCGKRRGKPLTLDILHCYPPSHGIRTARRGQVTFDADCSAVGRDMQSV